MSSGIVALVASVLCGAVPGDDAFAGFADPAVVAIAAALVLSAAIRDSGLLDAPLCAPRRAAARDRPRESA